MSRSRLRPATSEIDALFDAAQTGSQAALGRLLEGCRDYLLLIANRELGRDLHGKIGASDLVQETFVQAQLCFDKFHGTSERELLRWLRRILKRQILGARACYNGTAKRDISREASRTDDSSIRDVVEGLPSDDPTPSKYASANEDMRAIAQAVESLPEVYRRVIHMRYWEQLKFCEIGQRLGRSPAAARKLWLRAIDRLERCGSWNRGDE
jgi:RNA polymerase sigma-70 factor (ECF subfamily)